MCQWLDGTAVSFKFNFPWHFKKLKFNILDVKVSVPLERMANNVNQNAGAKTVEYVIL